MERPGFGYASGPIRILIVGSDRGLGESLRSLIESEGDMEIIGEARSGQDAIYSVRHLTPDVVLFDVELPGVNGIELIRRYGVEQFPITIFVACDGRYAVDAFQINAFDYLVRPLTDQHLHATLDRVRRHLHRESLRELSDRLEDLMAEVRSARSYPRHLSIRSRAQILILNVEKIEWVEADRKYSRVHIGGASHFVRESISHLEARLDRARFVRIHRSAIVNLDHVVEVVSAAGSTNVILKDGTSIPMSRSHKSEVLSFAGDEA